MQPVADKLPPVPRAGFATGNEAEEGRAPARYVHTIGTSSKAHGWTGLSVDGEDIERRKGRQKAVAVVIDSLNRCGREKQAKALATCGRYFDVWVHSNGDRKAVPCWCDNMFCPHCANRRSVPLVRKLKKLVNRRGRTYWFLTLTVPNVKDLMHCDITDISDQFSKLCNSWVFKEVEDENREPFRIYGGVRSIECVFEPKTKTWHPHIHVLFEGPKRLPRWWLTLLKHAWMGITGDARYLHLKRAYSITKRGKKWYNRLNEKALREVCKYVTKSAEFAGDHLLVDEFLNAFKNVRRIQCFGSFYGAQAKGPEREPGDECQSDPEVRVRLCDQGYRRLSIRAALSETEMCADGSRQFTFAFHLKIDAHLESADSDWSLTPEPEVSAEQTRIEFAGVMPEKSAWQTSLFEGAA